MDGEKEKVCGIRMNFPRLQQMPKIIQDKPTFRAAAFSIELYRRSKVFGSCEFHIVAAISPLIFEITQEQQEQKKMKRGWRKSNIIVISI
jgi:hypothetical protein